MRMPRQPVPAPRVFRASVAPRGRYVSFASPMSRGGLLGELAPASSLFDKITSGVQSLAQSYLQYRAASKGVTMPEPVPVTTAAPASGSGIGLGTLALIGGAGALAFVMLRKRR